MTIYQLKAKLKTWKKFKKQIEQGETVYWEILELAGVADIAKNERYYINLLRKAERAANDVIKLG